MLVLSRKINESILVGGNIEIVVLSSEGDTIKLGIKAPKYADIYRKELYDMKPYKPPIRKLRATRCR